MSYVDRYPLICFHCTSRTTHLQKETMYNYNVRLQTTAVEQYTQACNEHLVASADSGG
jgi:hypothetical protein